MFWVSLGMLAIPHAVFKHMQKALPRDVGAQLDCLRNTLDFPNAGPYATARTATARTAA